MRWGLVGLGWFCLAVAGWAQLVLPPIAPVGSDSATAVAPGLATPQATLRFFLNAMRADQLDEAAEALDLSGISVVLRREEGPRRAKLLYGVLQRLPALHPESLPSMTRDGPILLEAVRDESGAMVGEVRLVRSDDGSWRFGMGTVLDIPALYEAVESRPILWGESDRGRDAFDPTSFERTVVPSHLREGGFAGLRPWQWIGLGALPLTGLLAFLVARGLLWVIAAWWIRPARGTPLAKAVQRAFQAVGCLAFATASLAVLRILNLPEGLHAVLLFVLEAMQIVAGIFLGLGLVDAAFAIGQERADRLPRRAGNLVLPFTHKVARFAVVALGVVTLAASLGVNVGAILAGVGLGGLVIALAAKDSVENLFGSITIMLDMPFAVGDWVKIGEIDGVVEEINLRSTRIRTFEDSLITLPNSTLIKASVENMGARRRRRVVLRIPLGREATPDEVAEFCLALRAYIARHPAVYPDQIYTTPVDIGDNTVVVQALMYLDVATYEEELAAKGEVILEAKRLADLTARPMLSLASPSALTDAAAGTSTSSEG